MTTLTIKQNDSGRPVMDTLSDSTGPINLTGATVKMLARNSDTGATVINAAATVTSATAGAVSYSLTAADLATVAVLQFEWQITFSDGSIFTVPSSGYHYISILDDIAQ